MAATCESDEMDLVRRAEEALTLASAAIDPAIKAAYLDRAACYATQRELLEREGRREAGIVGMDDKEAI